jgi:predicted ABC-type ATPase
VSKKELIIAAGPNGSGKSTFVASLLEERSRPYLCADLIATEFPQLDPISRQLAAGREFLVRAEEQLTKDEDCIIETTMSGRTLKSYLVRARSFGYGISIVFIYLGSADASVARVKERVRRGGHDVPEADIRRRFTRSCANFWWYYRKIADQWLLVYNAGEGFDELAFGIGDDFEVADEELFKRFLEFAEAKDDG